MTKQQLRQETALMKKALSPEEKRRQEKEIWAKLSEFEEFKKAQTVLVYCSLPDEVNTADFLLEQYGIKRIIVPLVSNKDLLLKEFVPGRLHKGYVGIPEPDADLPDIDPSEIDLAIVPGIAFDYTGGRLGRGKGFYDRLLPALSCPVIGVAYTCQMVEAVPVDPWDRKVDKVIYPELNTY